MRVALLPLLFPAIAAALGDGEAEPILVRVSQRYASLRTFSVKVQNVLRGDIEASPLGNDIELAYRDGAHYFYRVRTSPSIGPLTVVRDGETVWTHNAYLREYIEEPGDVAGVKRGTSYGVGLFARTSASLLMRYAHLTNFIATSRLVGRQTLREPFYNGDTVLVDLRPPPDQTEQWTEQIWIDPRTNLIVKSAFARRGSDYPSVFHYTYLLVNEPIPDHLFSFRPPRNARRVERFSRIRPPG